MTAAQFRRLALSFPGVIESSHMSHPDFRVGGKIFATLGYPDNEHGMVVLPPDEQERFARASPKVFAPAKGAWGKRGSTTVDLEQLADDLVLARKRAAESNRIRIAFAVAAETIETGIVIASAFCGGWIDSIEIVQHGIDRCIETVEIEAIKSGPPCI